MAQAYTDPVALERMAGGRCPECGGETREHGGWGGPGGCSLTDTGVAARIDQFQKDAASREPERVNVLVLRGVEGPSVYLNEYRVGGPKPWGGGDVIYEWDADRADVLRALQMSEGLPTLVERLGPEHPEMKGWFDKLARTVAVDFDGVLHPYSAGWVGSVPADEPPVPGAEGFLKWCVENEYRVVVFSTRADHVEGKKGIEDWLAAHRLAQYVAEVTHTKPPAVAYVDDRAVPYRGSWASVRYGIEGLAGGRAHGAAE